MIDFNIFSSQNIFIDLATEAHALLRGDKNREIQGVSETVQEKNQLKITEITILNEEGAKKMKRPVGHYYTVEADSLFDDTTTFLPCSMEISAILKQLLKKNAKTLICGLGNPRVTADALGSKVTKTSMATHHLFRYMADQMEDGFSDVSLIAPDVMGNTGLETAEILKGTIVESGVDTLIVIDALAATAISRIGTSFQICDTGIVPGAGLGNQRLAINESTMGIPVIAVGVPTVVHFSAIIAEFFDKIKTADISEEMSAEDIQQYFCSNPISYAVTPKNIDMVTDGIADVLTVGLHLALHEGITSENYWEYLNLSGALL